MLVEKRRERGKGSVAVLARDKRPCIKVKFASHALNPRITSAGFALRTNSSCTVVAAVVPVLLVVAAAAIVAAAAAGVVVVVVVAAAAAVA
ncbi:hypothetical protein ElyMa_002196200 [Elysia marginata]|uniref:Uncharacterized protein n=1 Tax=Elysia marginata TaxID=1093978 RepID=A0AAV4FRB5_9GAST|nr:hypothetical protein ElyMa_002196200 [Elysia marginata]